MHLKRLELLGFKSFATKTVLELDAGVTALVGPNGSGKSNVVDAVRWALGEQSLRAVRSRKSEEVIFSGNARRSPVGMAEVTLVLDNSDGSLPLPYSEVSIARRHYRSGEGEYLINRARVRLRDVVELLSRVSLASDAYAVVGQGAVDEVLLQRPEERRALLEAAADISRHQLKLSESLDRLAETEANLRRVEDIRAEIVPRLSKLRTQANRARRHEELSSTLRQMLQWRYLLRLRRCREQAAGALESERSRAEKAAAAAAAHTTARERMARLGERLRREEAALEGARERLSALRLARARSEREAALLQEREAAHQRQLAEAEEEQARAEKELRELRTEVESLRALQSDLEAREARLAEETAPQEAERRRALSEQRLMQAQLDRAMGELQTASRRKSELQERRTAALRESGKADAVRAESGAAAVDAARRLAKLEEQIAGSDQELARLRGELTDAEARRQEAQGRLQAVGEQLDVARRKEREAWARDHDLRTRLSLLQSLKEEHRGIPAGAKALLDARLPGLHGTLASMIRAPAEYVIAVAAALGGAQAYVVSDGFADGLRALGFLEKRTARATIAPLRLDARDGETATPPFWSRLDGALDGIGFRGVAADLVTCDAEARELCARYLGLTLVVESMRDAVELYERLARTTDGLVSYQVVTMDGRVLRARGDLALARDGERNGSLLARETELVTLSEAAEQAQSDLKEIKASVASLEAGQKELSRSVAEEASAASRYQSQIDRLKADSTEVASQVARAEAAIEWHRSRAASAEREAAQARQTLARTEEEMAAANTRETEAKARAEQILADLADQQSAVAEISSRLSGLQSEVASTQNRLRQVEARASAVSEALERAEVRAEREAERVAESSAALAKLLQTASAAFPVASTDELDAAEKTVAEAAGGVAGLREGCTTAETEVGTLSQALEAAREALAGARSMAERATAETSALVAEVSRELDLDGSTLVAASGAAIEGVELVDPDSRTGGPGGPTVFEVPDDEGGHASPPLQEDDWEMGSPEGIARVAARLVETLGDLLSEAPLDSFPTTATAASERVAALRRELQALGTINAEAPEEYRQVSERQTFLTTQVDDLRRAERTLGKAIDQLREVMGARFQETFDLVNAEFVRCFTTLFGGGSARLVLTRPDQPLDGGVEVVAAPPGRKSGSLLGLSGGERALTAVAFLFALMKVHPSPFCLLDEVDAALDESNVQRFCQMVRELASSTQLVVITHNRLTMETADALYGVSMSGESMSRVVSLKLASKES